MIRYEINTKPGVILSATLIERVATAKPKTTPCLIVFVEKKNQVAFEKMIEGDPLVLGYQADPRAPGTVIKEWSRK